MVLGFPKAHTSIPVRGQLSYQYETDAIRNTFLNPGIVVFQLERSDAMKPAVRMQGFSSDLFNPTKLSALEEKVSENLLFNNAEVFEQAKSLHERHGRFVSGPVAPD